jgi:hypothetical protein
MPKVNCYYCNKPTYKRPSIIKKRRKVFCSRACFGKNKTEERSEIRRCVVCLNEFKAIKGNIKRRMTLCCSRDCLKKWRENNKKTFIDSAGYFCKDKKRLHREAVEKFLGRKLKREECVHHIDGNKLNNDISNLQILSQSEHSKIHFDKIKDKFLEKREYEKECYICGKKFFSKSNTAKYCSNSCVYKSRREYLKEWHSRKCHELTHRGK